jgi:transcriptional regulator with XRE-family HTH domain
MAKQYTSVTEMVKDISEDADFSESFSEEVAERRVAKMLFTLRCAQGVTQKEMAERLGCTQSRVSKLENATLDNLRVGDLMAYAKEFDLCLSLGFHPRMTAVEKVKFHAIEIKKNLDFLVSLAHKDDEILKGVKDFFGEALFNLLNFVQISAKKLPKKSRERQALIEVSSPTDLLELEEYFQTPKEDTLAKKGG